MAASPTQALGKLNTNNRPQLKKGLTAREHYPVIKQEGEPPSTTAPHLRDDINLSLAVT